MAIRKAQTQAQNSPVASSAPVASDLVSRVFGVLHKAEQVWEARLAEVQAAPPERRVANTRKATLVVGRQYSSAGNDGPMTAQDTELAVHSYETNPAQVSYELGATMNIGNFESVRVSVGVTVPCYREEIEAAYIWAKEFAEARLRLETAEVRAAQQSQSQPHAHSF
jgi:hypothetical protein